MRPTWQSERPNLLVEWTVNSEWGHIGPKKGKTPTHACLGQKDVPDAEIPCLGSAILRAEDGERLLAEASAAR